MPAGLQVIDDDEIIQIDDSYINYHLVYSQQFVSSVGSIVVRGVNPILFATIDGSDLFTSKCVCRGRVQNGDGFTFYLQATGSYSVYIFDLKPPVTGSNVGFQVFDVDGVMRFDSAAVYIRVLANSMLDPLGANNIQRFNLFPGKRVAAQSGSLGRSSWFDDDQGGGRYTNYYEECWTSGYQGGYAKVDTLLVYSSSLPRGGSASTSQALLIDVTGYPLGYRGG